MVGEFRFYLDSIEVNEIPQGWESLVTTIRLDRELKGLFTIMDVTLTFYGDGYDRILAARQTYGYCHQHTFEIRQFSEDVNAHVPIYTGTLFIKDCEFQKGIQNETEKGSVKCAIQDNSFFAKIKNNRNLKAKIYVGKSKNNVNITPCPYYKIEYFSCATAGYYSVFTGAGSERNNTAFRLWDVMKYFVDYMSDGQMDFYSDAFDDAGMYGGYMVTNGYLLRFAEVAGVSQSLFEQNWDALSFADLFKEIDKEFNICFVAGFDGGRPYLRIENYEYLYPNATIETLDNVDSIKQRVASEYLYDRYILGCDITTNEPTLTSFPYDVRYVGFKHEEYVGSTTCNLDRSLELVNSWIIDTNTIELLIEFGGTSAPLTYDLNFALVKCTFDTGVYWKADKSNWITGGATPVFYNESLNASNKMGRYASAIPNSIGIQLGTVDNTFSSHSTTQHTVHIWTTPLTVSPVECTIEDADPNNNYNAAGKYYVAPTAGVYAFSSSSTYIVNHIGGLFIGCPAKIYVYLDVYANADTPGVDPALYSINIKTYNSASICGIPFTLNGSGSLNLSALQKVALRIVMETEVVGLLGNTEATLISATFNCISSADGGGIYTQVDTSKFPIYRNQFAKYPYSLERFLALQADPKGLIGFGIANENLSYGHLEELKFYNAKKESDWTIISNETLTQ